MEKLKLNEESVYVEQIFEMFLFNFGRKTNPQAKPSCRRSRLKDNVFIGVQPRLLIKSKFFFDADKQS